MLSTQHNTPSTITVGIPIEIWLTILAHFDSNLELFTLKRTSKYFYRIIHFFIKENAKKADQPRFVSLLQRTSFYFSFSDSDNQLAKPEPKNNKTSVGQQKRIFDHAKNESDDNQPPQKKLRRHSPLSTKEMHISAEEARTIIINPSYTLADRYRVLSCVMENESLNQNQIDVISEPDENNKIIIKWKRLEAALASHQTSDLAKKTLLNNLAYISTSQRIKLFGIVLAILPRLDNRYNHKLHKSDFLLFESMLDIIRTCIEPDPVTFKKNLASLWEIIYSQITVNDEDFAKLIHAFLTKKDKLTSHFFNFIITKMQANYFQHHSQYSFNHNLIYFIEKMSCIFNDVQKNILCSNILEFFSKTYCTDKPALISLFATLQPTLKQPYLQTILTLIKTDGSSLLWIKAYGNAWNTSQIKNFLSLFFESSNPFNSELHNLLTAWLHHSPIKLQQPQLDFIITRTCQFIDSKGKMLENTRNMGWELLLAFIDHWDDHVARFKWILKHISIRPDFSKNRPKYPMKAINQLWSSFDLGQQLTLLDNILQNLQICVDANRISYTFEFFQFFTDHFASWNDDQLRKAWLLFFRAYQNANNENILKLTPFMQSWEQRLKNHTTASCGYFNDLVNQVIQNVNHQKTDLEKNLIFLFHIETPNDMQRRDILNFVLRFATDEHFHCRKHASEKLILLIPSLTPEESQLIASHSISSLTQHLENFHFHFIQTCAQFWSKEQIKYALPQIFSMLANKNNYAQLWDIIKTCRKKLTPEEQHSIIHQPMSQLMKEPEFSLQIDYCHQFSEYAENWIGDEIENALKTTLRHCCSLTPDVRSCSIQWITIWGKSFSQEQRDHVFNHVRELLTHNPNHIKSNEFETATLLLPYWNQNERDTLAAIILNYINSTLSHFFSNGFLTNLARWKADFKPEQLTPLTTALHQRFVLFRISCNENIAVFTEHFNQKQNISLFKSIFASKPLYQRQYPDFQKNIIEFLRVAWKNIDSEGKQFILNSIDDIFISFHNNFKIQFFDLLSYWLATDTCSMEQLEKMNFIQQHHFWPLLKATHEQFLTLKDQIKLEKNKSDEQADDVDVEANFIQFSVFYFPEETQSNTTVAAPSFKANNPHD